MVSFEISSFFGDIYYSLCSIWILNKKVGLHKKTQQKLWLEGHGSHNWEKFQKSYDGLF